MSFVVGLAGVCLLVVVFWDAFETIILPRRVTRKFRLARAFYKNTWIPYSAIARRLRQAKRRESWLSIYGPMSLLVLFMVWGCGLMLGFATLQWALGSQFNGITRASFRTDLYMSGSTFFTLGLGDITPRTPLSRALTVMEAGLGFGFLAVVVSYLPVLYQSFSRREVNISMLDARAGSPPTAAELLRRHVQGGSIKDLADYLRSWEIWAAELMESHLSYPALCYFRSQHNNQSWVSALTTILDACSLLMAYTEGELRWQAQMSFAICRHALVDLCQVMDVSPKAPDTDRLSTDDLCSLKSFFKQAEVPLHCPDTHDEKVQRLRSMYEPYANALGRRLLFSLPPWSSASPVIDNWRTTAWGGPAAPVTITAEDDHL